MALDSVVKSYLPLIQKLGVKKIAKQGAAAYQTFYYQDLSITAVAAPGKKPAFMGLTFRLFDEVFYVTDDYSVSYQDAAGKTMTVEDPGMLKELEAYLQWRLNFLQRFSL